MTPSHVGPDSLSHDSPAYVARSPLDQNPSPPRARSNLLIHTHLNRGGHQTYPPLILQVTPPDVPSHTPDSIFISFTLATRKPRRKSADCCQEIVASPQVLTPQPPLPPLIEGTAPLKNTVRTAPLHCRICVTYKCSGYFVRICFQLCTALGPTNKFDVVLIQICFDVKLTDTDLHREDGERERRR